MKTKILYVCILLGLAVPMVSADESAPHKAARPPIHGILFSEDCADCFTYDPPGKMKPERLDEPVDELANSQVTIMLINCNGQKANYDSKVRETMWGGFDPKKGNDQPFFAGVAPERVVALRQVFHNMRAMFEAGIDPNQRMIDRCRKRGISPWISIRMNDIHDAEVWKSPCLHSRFWIEHPEYWRVPDPTDVAGVYFGRCFNYGLKPVRDDMMALIQEVCNRYDMDGLELDWNRFPLHLPEGKEIEQGKRLNKWMGEVRATVRLAEKKWGHPIWLAVRVPTRPEVSVGIGLDAITWAKQGSIDHVIVSPFLWTTDFDVPVERWDALLKGTGVGVTVGLEAAVRAYPNPGGPGEIPNTPERHRGAAMAALARGSQGIYLFNHFGIGKSTPYLLNEMHSVDTLVDKDRSYVVTFTDISIPGKPIPSALVKTLAPGKSANFRLFIGPKPLATARGEVLLTLVSEKEKPEKKHTAKVMLNGRPSSTVAGFNFKPDDFRNGYNTIRVTNAGETPLTVFGVELALRLPGGKRE